MHTSRLRKGEGVVMQLGCITAVAMAGGRRGGRPEGLGARCTTRITPWRGDVASSDPATDHRRRTDDGVGRRTHLPIGI